MSSILTLETNKYDIKLENFEGPLDLLYHLIEKNKLDIYEVKLEIITDQYMDYLKQAEKLDLEIASEFLVIASTLLYIKSKNLLPDSEEEEEEITEEELKQKIIEYKRYKDFSNLLKERQKDFDNRFFRMPVIVQLPNQKIEETMEQSLIQEMYTKVIKRNKNKINYHAKNIDAIAMSDSVSVASKVKDIFRELLKNHKFVFNKLFKERKYTKVEIVTSFIGLLELTRKNKIVTNQDEIFGDITVEKIKKEV